jgi:hypothetical protein
MKLENGHSVWTPDKPQHTEKLPQEKRFAELFRSPGNEGSVCQRLGRVYSTVASSLDDENKRKFTSLATQILKQEIQTGTQPENVCSMITTLQTFGIPVGDLASVFDPLLDHVAEKWSDAVDLIQRSFDRSSHEACLASIDEGYASIQGIIEKDSKQWQGVSNLQQGISLKMLHLQCATMVSFLSHAISSQLSLIKTASMTPKEQKDMLEWVDALSHDFKHYATNPAIAQGCNIQQLLQSITTLRSKIQGAPITLPTSTLGAVASKICIVAKTVFRWLPYILPIAISGIAGHRAEGVRGAAMAAGVATATSILALSSGYIAKKATIELSKLYFIPACLRQPVGAVIGFAIRMNLMVAMMQANCIMAGAISKGAAHEAPPDGAWEYTKSIVGGSLNVPYQGIKLIGQEISLISAVTVPDLSRGPFEAIHTVVEAQIKASVAGYNLGQAAIQVPKTAFQLAQAMLTN